MLDALFRSFVRPSPSSSAPRSCRWRSTGRGWSTSGMGDSVKLSINGTEGLLIDAELVLTEHSEQGAIPFEIRLAESALGYDASIDDGALVHRALGAEAYLVRERSEPEALSTYLNREGTTIWFEQEVFIDGSVLYRIDRDRPPIDLEKLVVLSWMA